MAKRKKKVKYQYKDTDTCVSEPTFKSYTNIYGLQNVKLYKLLWSYNNDFTKVLPTRAYIEPPPVYRGAMQQKYSDMRHWRR